MSRVIRSFSTSESLHDEVQAAASKEGISQSAVINRALIAFFQTQVKRSSWETDSGDSWYDPKKFYTGSEDKKGHSALVRIWVPKNLAGQIGRVVKTGMIPELRSNNDFYRDALFHRAKTVAQWLDDNELKTEVDLHMMIAEEQAISQQKLDVEQLVTEVTHNLEEAWRREDWVWLDRYVEDRLAKSAAIPEAHRPKYVAVLKDYEKRLRGRVEGKRRA